MIPPGTERPFFRWDWVGSHLGEIADRVLEHLVLTGIAVGVGLIISALLAAVALRFRRTYGPITSLSGGLYAIPSLALFAFLVPITGLTMVTAQIGLVSYTLLILIRSMVTGIDGVDPAIREAAIGMGYSRRRLLLEVEIPLAMPVILAGIRVTAVTTVGLVTITALIGRGGLGFLILRGLTRFFWTEVIVAITLSVTLAATIDRALVLLGRLVAPWTERRARVGT